MDTSMAAKVEIKFGRVANLRINHSTWQYVATSICHSIIRREQAGVMPLLHHNKRNWREIFGFQ
nr:hypothetical protein Iba_chr08bCG11800 [Ipomoea batatas]